MDEQGAQLKEVLYALSGTTRVGSPGFLYGFHADISPDGAQLAYTSCQFTFENPVVLQFYRDLHGPELAERSRYHYEIALTGLDGSNQQRLTHDGGLNHYPVWSPDGDRIAFTAGHLYTMSPDGSDVQPVVEAPSGLLHSKSRIAFVPPVWSPDGQRLAFVANEGKFIPRSRRTVYTVRPDGSELFKVGEMGAGVTSSLDPTAAPTWSPDGERIAFAGWDGEEFTIHTVRYDGEDLRLVWDGRPNDNPYFSQVSWSPDGSELLFVSDYVYIARLDGSVVRRLPAMPAGPHTVAAWSPDGSRIAVYKTDYLGSPDPRLYTVSRDGRDLRLLVESDRDGELRLAQSTQPEATAQPVSDPTATAPPPG